jgi:hypothetical protein
MRYLKMLGLVAVAIAALMAILGAASASATVLCSTTADPCPAGQKWPAGTTLDLSVPAGGSILQTDTAGNTLGTCAESTVKWKIINPGSATETVTGVDEETTWGKCTVAVNTIKLANTEIHKIAGTSNGTVTADGVTEITINTALFGSCVYAVANGASLGDITEGNPAIFHLNAVTKRLSGFCPETDKWTGTYVVTSPANTTLSVSNS